MQRSKIAQSKQQIWFGPKQRDTHMMRDAQRIEPRTLARYSQSQIAR